MSGYVNKFEDLKRWFLSLNHNKWNLYHGHQKGKLTTSGLLYKSSDDSLDVDASFEHLKEMIKMHSNGGGKFTIYVPNISNNTGPKCYFTVEQPNAQNSGIAGIYGYNTNSIEQAIAKEKKMWEMEQKIAHLEAEKAPSNAFDRFAEQFLEEVDLNQLSQQILGLVSSFFNKKPITMQGIHTQPPHDQQKDKQVVYEYKDERLVPILNTIRPHFSTDEEFYNFLTVIAQKFSQNPQGIRLMIGV